MENNQFENRPAQPQYQPQAQPQYQQPQYQPQAQPQYQQPQYQPQVQPQYQQPQPQAWAPQPAAPNAAPAAPSSAPKAKIPSKKVLLIAGIAAAVVILAVVLIIVLTSAGGSNTYETPVKLFVEQANQKTFSNPFDTTIKQLNGFSEKQLKTIFSYMEDTEVYDNLLERYEESFEYQVEHYEDQYGSNYKFSYEIEDRDELDSDDLKNMKNSIKNTAKRMLERLEVTEDFESDDWEDMADEMGLSKSDAKGLVNAMIELFEEWKDVEVTDGYELEVILITNGSELDEPDENDTTINVYKVNGRWVLGTYISTITSMLSNLVPYN